MSTLVPGTALAASALSTSGSFVSSFSPVLSVAVALALVAGIIGIVSTVWRG